MDVLFVRFRRKIALHLMVSLHLTSDPSEFCISNFVVVKSSGSKVCYRVMFRKDERMDFCVFVDLPFNFLFTAVKHVEATLRTAATEAIGMAATYNSNTCGGRCNCSS